MIRWETEKTICAIASGAVGALRGIIRVSGPNCLEVVQKCNPMDLGNCQNLKSATRIPSWLDLGEPLGKIGCDFWIWPDTRSYTGQPSVELHLLGAIPILEACIALLGKNGASLAEPGEFTFRSFLAGRMDLAQCEAVLGVIDAQSTKGLDTALQQLCGGLQLPMSELRTELIHLLADLEAGLDFVDEDIEFVSRPKLIERLEHALDTIAPLLKQIDVRSLSDATPAVALFGNPNAGKSSLLNALAGFQAALVSDQPGTTRDFIRVRSKQAHLHWVDTAGIESINTDDPRSMAQNQTRRQWDQADLRWWCIDLSNDSQSPSSQYHAAFSHFNPKFGDDVWWIATKVDLASPQWLDDWQKLAETFPNETWIETSSQSGQGLGELQEAVRRWSEERESEVSNILPTTMARCRGSLIDAAQSLDQGLDAAKNHFGDELVASELRLALDHLGIVTGEVYTDDILDALFSRFCIGK